MIISGKTIANHILEDLSKRTHQLFKQYHVIPHLAVIRVGDDQATSSYIAQKQKMATQIGAMVSVYNHPLNVMQTTLEDSINFLQQQGDIHGIILQLPIPSNLNQDILIQKIDPQHDIDGFVNGSPFIVPIASAVMKILQVILLKETETGSTKENLEEWLKTQGIVIMGKGKTGGTPIMDYLRKLHIPFTLIDSQTPSPETLTKNADIIICAVGKYGILKSSMIKKDVILIGIGMDQDEGVFYGDYDENDIKDIAKYYTPIPGGVGPVNVACLLENLVIAVETTVKQ